MGGLWLNEYRSYMRGGMSRPTNMYTFGMHGISLYCYHLIFFIPMAIFAFVILLVIFINWFVSIA